MSIELVAPAGSPEALDAAVGEGADAVYLGLKTFNARMRSVNFDYARFEGALKALRRMGRRLYVTVNTVFEQREADRMYQLLKYLAALGPDGIIVQDFGTVAMVRECFPSLKLHASTQMNIASARGTNMLSKYGVSRVVLARELSLEEICALRAATNMELEVFVHGALCVSVSGLCLFSSYLGGKSANRGMCTQACRRLYRHDDREGYYFSPADLQLLERLPDLAAAGVNALKIEGRMKGAEYAGAVVSAYRLVLDALSEGAGEDRVRESMKTAREILRGDFARVKTVFYFDGEKTPPDSWLDPDRGGGTGIPLGKIIRVEGSGEERRGLLAAGPDLPVAGDSVRFHRADDTERKSRRVGFAKDDKDGRWISIPQGFAPGDSVYLIRKRPGRYAKIIPGGLENFRRRPGRDKAPELRLPPGEKGIFPEGLYAAVSRVEDLYPLQAYRPVRVILGYNRKTAARLLDGKPLPFRPDDLVIALDPFFPEAMNGPLAAEMRQLMDMGYRRFVVNNPGHFSLFREKRPAADRAAAADGPVLVAGPYLYVFNRWASSLVSSFGADYFVSPLENNRQNLEKTVEHPSRSRAFVTVFAFPALFRMRTDPGGMYDFDYFTDGRGEGFRLVHADGAMVYPAKPFSIVDKIPFLEKAGFRRFIADFSGPPLKKKDLKTIMEAIKNAAPLPGTVRFNWKDGFHSEETGPYVDSRSTSSG
ncbi:MAG: U32 family peptidase [Treponema sp.]|jgi:putative protease|nr:U32 family peptidase [Treponema sp.]